MRPLRGRGGQDRAWANMSGPAIKREGGRERMGQGTRGLKEGARERLGGSEGPPREGGRQRGQPLEAAASARVCCETEFTDGADPVTERRPCRDAAPVTRAGVVRPAWHPSPGPGAMTIRILSRRYNVTVSGTAGQSHSSPRHLGPPGPPARRPRPKCSH